jgi:hypothetical protein
MGTDVVGVGLNLGDSRNNLRPGEERFKARRFEIVEADCPGCAVGQELFQRIVSLNHLIKPLGQRLVGGTSRSIWSTPSFMSSSHTRAGLVVPAVADPDLGLAEHILTSDGGATQARHSLPAQEAGCERLASLPWLLPDRTRSCRIVRSGRYFSCSSIFRR